MNSAGSTTLATTTITSILPSNMVLNPTSKLNSDTSIYDTLIHPNINTLSANSTIYTSTRTVPVNTLPIFDPLQLPKFSVTATSIYTKAVKVVAPHMQHMQVNTSTLIQITATTSGTGPSDE